MDDTVEKMVDDYFEIESFGVKLAPQVAGSDDVAFARKAPRRSRIHRGVHPSASDLRGSSDQAVAYP